MTRHDVDPYNDEPQRSWPLESPRFDMMLVEAGVSPSRYAEDSDVIFRKFENKSESKTKNKDHVVYSYPSSLIKIFLVALVLFGVSVVVSVVLIFAGHLTGFYMSVAVMAICLIFLGHIIRIAEKIDGI